MDEDTLNDLKQFIAATVAQATSHLATQEDLLATKEDIAKLGIKLDKKIDARADEILSAVGEAMTTYAETTDEEIGQLKTRVSKLEARAA